MVSGTRALLKWVVVEVEGEQGSGPKGNKSCRTQGESVRPSVRPSVCLPSVQDALLFRLSLNNMEK